jgi:hypothetical protein
LGLIFTVPVINAEELKNTSSSKKRKVFISYHSKSSKVIVEKFVKKLKAEGYDVWCDIYEIQEGDIISLKLEKGINESSIVVCFISNEYIRSNTCYRELLYSLFKKKKLIYLVTENLDLSEDTRFKFRLRDDCLRLDLYKLDKNNLINEVFNKLEPILKT